MDDSKTLDEILASLPDSDEEDTVREESPVISLADQMLGWGLKKRVTHLCLELKKDEKQVLVRMRRDGVWHHIKDVVIPMTIMPSLTTRLKVLAEADISIRRSPQAGFARLANDVGEKQEVFICFLPTAEHEEICLEYLSASPTISYPNLSVPEEIHLRLQDICEQDKGMILVTGPDGSGRMTTLFNIAENFFAQNKKLIILEREVSERLPAATHVQVNMGRYNNSFSMALLASLRHLPDAVLMSEMQGQENVNTAIRTASSRTLVLASMTADSLTDSIFCLLDMGMEPYLVASNLKIFVNQRLIRLLCSKCKQPSPDPESPFQVVGCPDCQGTGYDGVMPVFESVIMGDELRAAMTDKEKSRDQLRKIIRQTRMGGLRKSALDMVRQGLTTKEEALRKAPAEIV